MLASVRPSQSQPNHIPCDRSLRLASSWDHSDWGIEKELTMSHGRHKVLALNYHGNQFSSVTLAGGESSVKKVATRAPQ